MTQSNDNNGVGQFVPMVCGIRTLPEDLLGYFCWLYTDLWITFEAVRVSLDKFCDILVDIL